MTATTDHEGRVAFEGLPVGSYRMQVTHPARRMPFVADVQVARSPREEVFELGVATIEGRVVSETGDPLAGIAVRVAPLNEEGYYGSMDFRVTIRESENGGADYEMSQTSEQTARTDREGRYELHAVRSDEDLRVSISGEFIVSESRDVPALARDEVRSQVDFAPMAAGCLELELTGLVASGRDRYTLKLTREAEGKVDSRRVQLRASRPRYTQTSLAPGDWKAEVFLGNAEQPLVERTFEVVAGERRPARIPMP